MNTIITIGREYGSGGREIGKLVAEKLDVPFYDKEILTHAAAESGLCQEIFEQHDEKASMSGLLGMGGMHPSASSSMGLQMPLNQRVFLAQFEAISSLASAGPCVIVGRCADYVLRDWHNVVHVFLYASEQKRVERIMRVERVDESRARDLIKKTDKQRKNYYNFFADGNWGMRNNYDLMLRTDGLTADMAANLVIAFATMRSQE